MSFAFVFPGQGSQSVGMMQKLADVYPTVKNMFYEASNILNEDLWDIICNDPDEKINSTDITQPIMLTSGYATWRLWKDMNGADPGMMAGHSLGEYTALVCAGVIDFADAVKLVSERGKYMQQAVPVGTGAMAAIIGLDDDAVKQVCADAAQGEIVEAVNFNCPGQVVIAGQKAAVERAIDIAKQSGAKRALLLAVSIPSHCKLMKPAAEKLSAILRGIELNKPVIPIVNNADAAILDETDAIRDALVRQLYQPVRWVEIINKMASSGIERIIECGPGKVLMGLNKRIDKTLTHAAIVDETSLLAQINN